ncbi:MAG: hypothetical protein U9N39_08415 [Campylobacterota bacterium]|nr:hypothetical protein [Campylobacterota bacterium]
MQITTSSNSVNITGNIKSITDYQEIKKAINTIVDEHKTVNITIQDSLSITSSIIGYFNKLVLKDAIKINMQVGSEQLLELLEDLSLTSTFNVRKVH